MRQPMGTNVLPRWLLPVLFSAALALGCSTPKPKVLIPPRVDLGSFGNLALIEFSATGGERLGMIASREFLSAMQSAQPGTPVLELGDERRALGSFSGGALDPQALRALGERYHVDAIVVGQLEAHSVKPNVSFDSAVRWVTASAQLEGILNARIIDTHTGATLWSSGARATREIAHVDLSNGNVAGTSPDDARQELIEALVGTTTSDFWAHWQ